MKHLALPVSDQERSRRFYESYFGFDARPPRRYDGDVLMLYNADGFSLALGPTDEPIRLPAFLHFGIHVPSPEAVRVRFCPSRAGWPTTTSSISWTAAATGRPSAWAQDVRRPQSAADR